VHEYYEDFMTTLRYHFEKLETSFGHLQLPRSMRRKSGDEGAGLDGEEKDIIDYTRRRLGWQPILEKL
jgi:hypothetical protein